MVKVSVASSIKQTIKEFIEDIKCNVLDDRYEADLTLASFFFSKLSEKDSAEYVIKYILPYKKKIESKDLNFFVKERGIIFSGCCTDSKKMDKLTKDITDISKENMDVVWEYFSVLVDLGEEYKKKE